jgi:hypothetical protein
MTDPATPAPDLQSELPVEVLVQASPDCSAAWLVLRAGDGSVLEVPLSKRDAVQLIGALAEYAYPGERLRATPPAGRG